MATRRPAQKSTAAKPKEAPRAALADKEPTDLHTGFAEYIESETGVSVDLKTVQLATILRMDYQRSDGNQARLEANRTAKAEADAEREKNREEREAKRAEKERLAAEKAAAKKEADAKAKTETPAKKTTPAKKAASTAGKKAAPARRRPAAAKAASEDM